MTIRSNYNDDVPREVADPYHELAIAIVITAVEDYRDLSNGNIIRDSYKKYKNPIVIKEFFHSEWCDLLLHGTSFTGEAIWDRLEELYGRF